MVQFLKLKNLCLLHGQVFVMSAMLGQNYHSLSGTYYRPEPKVPSLGNSTAMVGFEP